MNTLPRFGIYNILEYANGIYQGELNQNHQRHGQGIFYWNTGELFYGSWMNDQITGEGVLYFSFGGYVYGDFLSNRVHGFGKLYFPNQDYLLGNWHHGRLNGLVLRYFAHSNKWIICQYQLKEPVKKILEGNSKIPSDILNELEGIDTRDLITYLNTNNKIHNDKGQSLSKIGFINFNDNSWYHGMLTHNKPNGLGILYYNDSKNDRGIFKNGFLEGVGRAIFKNGDIYDGFFRKGKFHGLGIYYKNDSNQFMYGMYENDICIQEIKIDEGYPQILMRLLKGNFHYPNKEFRQINTDVEVLSLGNDDNYQLMENIASKRSLETMRNSKDYQNGNPLSEKSMNDNPSGDFNDYQEELYRSSSEHMLSISHNIAYEFYYPRYITSEMSIPLYEIFTISSKNNQLPNFHNKTHFGVMTKRLKSQQSNREYWLDDEVKGKIMTGFLEYYEQDGDNHNNGDDDIEDNEDDHDQQQQQLENNYDDQVIVVVDLEEHPNIPVNLQAKRKSSIFNTQQGLGINSEMIIRSNRVYKADENRPIPLSFLLPRGTVDHRTGFGYQAEGGDGYTPLKGLDIEPKNLKYSREVYKEPRVLEKIHDNDEFVLNQGQFDTLGNHYMTNNEYNLVYSKNQGGYIKMARNDANNKLQNLQLQRKYPIQQYAYIENMVNDRQENKRDRKSLGIENDGMNTFNLVKPVTKENHKQKSETMSKSPMLKRPSHLENYDIIEKGIIYQDFDNRQKNDQNQRKIEESSPKILEKKRNLLKSLTDLIKITDDLNKLKKSNSRNKSNKRNTSSSSSNNHAPLNKHSPDQISTTSIYKNPNIYNEESLQKRPNNRDSYNQHQDHNQNPKERSTKKLITNSNEHYEKNIAQPYNNPGSSTKYDTHHMPKHQQDYPNLIDHYAYNRQPPRVKDKIKKSLRPHDQVVVNLVNYLDDNDGDDSDNDNGNNNDPSLVSTAKKEFFNTLTDEINFNQYVDKNLQKKNFPQSPSMEVNYAKISDGSIKTANFLNSSCVSNESINKVIIDPSGSTYIDRSTIKDVYHKISNISVNDDNNDDLRSISKQSNMKNHKMSKTPIRQKHQETSDIPPYIEYRKRLELNKRVIPKHKKAERRVEIALSKSSPKDNSPRNHNRVLLDSSTLPHQLIITKDKHKSSWIAERPSKRLEKTYDASTNPTDHTNKTYTPPCNDNSNHQFSTSQAKLYSLIHMNKYNKNKKKKKHENGIVIANQQGP